MSKLFPSERAETLLLALTGAFFLGHLIASWTCRG